MRCNAGEAVAGTSGGWSNPATWGGTPPGLDPRQAINLTLDSDGDGQTDLLEVHAGTGRLDAADRFAWSVQPPDGQPAPVLMAVKPGTTYRIHSTNDLAASGWAVIDSMHPMEAGTHEFSETSVIPKRFYRIEILLDSP